MDVVFVNDTQAEETVAEPIPTLKPQRCRSGSGALRRYGGQRVSG